MSPSNVPGGLGDVIRRILTFNTRGFSYLMEYFNAQRATPDTITGYQISKAGFQNNYYLLKQLEGMEFYPEDDNSREYNEALSLDFAQIQGKIENEVTADASKMTDKDKDIAELLKIASLPDNRELSNNTNDINKEKIIDPGTETLNPEDWYKRIFRIGEK